MFSFTARGSKAEVLQSLGGVTDTSMGNDPLGIAIRDAAIRAIQGSDDPVGRYYVYATGDGHATTGPATLSVSITTEGLGLGDKTEYGRFLRHPGLPRIRDYPPARKRELERPECQPLGNRPDWPA